jgi:hypothetical protein
MYDENINKTRYHEYLHWIRRMYCSGRLIQDKDWKILSDMTYTMDKINARSHYLKQQTVIDNFLGEEIEDFVVLTNSYHKLLKVAINTSDYLKKQLGKDVEDEDVIFETDAEALEAIETAFEDIEKIKADNEQYLTGEFE